MPRGRREAARGLPRRCARSAIGVRLAVVLGVVAAACAPSSGGELDDRVVAGGDTSSSTTTTAVNPSSEPSTPASPPPPAPPPPPPARPRPQLPGGEDSVVARIVDGDTLVVAGGVRVRLIGIDTPETKDPRRGVQCFGAEAARRLGELTPPGSAVRLVHDVERTDRYGRTLAYLYRLPDGLFVNAALVRDGFATVATYPPNVAFAEQFVALQRQAREEGAGLWGACPADGRAPGTTTGGTPAPAPAPGPGTSTGEGCDPSYPDFCIPPPPPDLDCKDVEGRNFTVRGDDPHGFDGNRDGVGCRT